MNISISKVYLCYTRRATIQVYSIAVIVIAVVLILAVVEVRLFCFTDACEDVDCGHYGICETDLEGSARCTCSSNCTQVKIDSICYLHVKSFYVWKCIFIFYVWYIQLHLINFEIILKQYINHTKLSCMLLFNFLILPQYTIIFLECI